MIGVEEPIAWKLILGTYTQIRVDRPITALCFPPGISNHGISPNDSVSDSGLTHPL